MSTDTVAEIRRLLSAGEIDSREASDRLAALDQDTAREQIWTRYADGGLFDDAIRQEGFESHAGALVQQVDTDA